MIGFYISLSLLIIVSGVHIFSLVKQNYKLKSITKVFILPLIIACYLFGTKTINWLVLSALICGWIGDLILIKKSKLWMAIGGFLFLADQLLITSAILFKINYANVSLVLLICLPICFLLISTIFNYILIKNHVNPVLFVFSVFYLAFNGLTLSMAICLTVSTPIWQYGLLVLGTALFFISDAVLIYVRIVPNPKIDKRHIFIMITYILAQFFSMFGLI